MISQTKKGLFYALALVTLIASSCKKDDDSSVVIDSDILVLNYGSYNGSESSFSNINSGDYSVINNAYKHTNGQKMVSNAQYAYEHGNRIYMTGNAIDQLFYVNKQNLLQTVNGITTDIGKPRFCVAEGKYLYVSCWGRRVDWDIMPDSYIAKINIDSNEVESTITLPGGPEGLAIANGKLYAALNFKDSIAVVHLSNDSVSYIETPAVSSYFLKDPNNNLYVSLISTYTKFSMTTGIAHINTTTNSITDIYTIADVSSGYSNIMSANADFSKIYLVTGGWVEVSPDDWELQGSISVFNVADKKFDPTPLISGIKGLNGLTVNPKNNDLYYFISVDTKTPGKVVVLDSKGTEKKSIEVGIAPSHMLFIK